MDTTPFWAGERERAAELDAARAEGASLGRRRIVEALQNAQAAPWPGYEPRTLWSLISMTPDGLLRLADEIEKGRL